MGNAQGVDRGKRRLVIQGLPGSGVSTVLRALKLGDVKFAEPTEGFRIEIVTFKNAIFSAWSSGDFELWRPFYLNTDAVIFVVDASNLVAENRRVLHEVLLEEALDDAKVLVFANKMDRSDLDPDDVAQRLQLHRLVQDWHLQPCVALNGGSGLYEGLDWLSAAISTVHAPEVRSSLEEDDDICLATPVQLLFGDKANELLANLKSTFLLR
mmetsp:Transcript_22340/g.68772  ORF Transcript_22340/g.68772 Transcript_22340/m.68772 type:complete len:211 (+) Transcript_22340:126-758(+)